MVAVYLFLELRFFSVFSVTFSRLEPEGKLVMGFRKASSAQASDQVWPRTMAKYLYYDSILCNTNGSGNVQCIWLVYLFTVLILADK